MRYICRMRFFCVLCIWAVAGVGVLKAQSDTVPLWRKPLVYGVMAGGTALSITGLYFMWYADSESSSFHLFDDSRQWGGMDKFGHATTAYALSMLGDKSLQWAGVPKRRARWMGGVFALGYMTGIEILDGFSAAWGFSLSDMAANAFGTGLYVGQEYLWNEQRIRFKYSFWPSQYARYRPEVLGDGIHQEWLKDYNGQRYWLSMNLKSFLAKSSESKFPAWLNVAAGYSVNGFLGGASNPNHLPYYPRYASWYLSPDIDWRKIPTRSGFLKALFTGLNFVKVPAPAIEFNAGPGPNIRWHWLFF